MQPEAWRFDNIVRRYSRIVAMGTVRIVKKWSDYCFWIVTIKKSGLCVHICDLHCSSCFVILGKLKLFDPKTLQGNQYN